MSVERVVAGGLGLAHDTEGRVVLVAGALGGERVVARVDRVQRTVVHATTIDVVDASPDRVAPPCPFLHAGCGGCDLQHATAAAQADIKRGIVVDALRRIAHLADAPVATTVALAPSGYRTTVRALVTHDGEVALRRARSHDPVRIETCLVAHPLVDEIVGAARFPGAREVTIRVGAHTGERLVVVDRAAASARGVPDDVAVVDRRHAVRAAIHEEVDGVRLRISGTSFFQPHADSPAVLTRMVRDHLGACETLADVCCGVGLFGALVDADRVVGVDTNAAAIADARHNLTAIGRRHDVRRADIAHTTLPRADAVVADPGREGLGATGVRAVEATGAARVVLVSCDAAAGARDARLLVDAGFDLDSVTPVDQFPHTTHIEVVSAFTR